MTVFGEGLQENNLDSLGFLDLIKALKETF